MPQFVTLIRFTDQGAHNIKKSASRARAFCKAAQKAGVAVGTQLWTLGSWDGVVILKGGEREVLHCLAELKAQGNVSTQTMQAFDSAEFEAACK